MSLKQEMSPIPENSLGAQLEALRSAVKGEDTMKGRVAYDALVERFGKEEIDEVLFRMWLSEEAPERMGLDESSIGKIRLMRLGIRNDDRMTTRTAYDALRKEFGQEVADGILTRIYFQEELSEGRDE